MQAYFENRDNKTQTGLLYAAIMGLLGVAYIAVTLLILTGWIALGERANISRRDINFNEWAVAIGAALLGLGALRTTWGLYLREHISWAWLQWMAFITLLVGFAVAMSALLGSTQTDELNVERTVVGLLVFSIAALVYRFAIQGATYTPDQRIRLQLAESPSAGAIIGLVVILLGFSMASDLFLETTSIASILSNNATKGIIAIGIATLMISGEFDLSVGSVLGVTAMLYMIFMGEGFQGIGLFSFGAQPTVVAAILALFFACIMGLINGLLLVTTRIPSFIVTLGTLFAYRAIALVFIGGGRILRYRDYFPPPAEFPQVYISHWVIAALAIGGALFVLFTALQAVPAYWRNTKNSWANLKDREMGTVIATAITIWMILGSIALLLAFSWLVLVAFYHLERVNFADTIAEGDFWVAVVLGLIAGGIIAGINLYPNLTAKSGKTKAGESYSIPTIVPIWILWIVVYALIAKVYDLKLDLNNIDASFAVLIGIAALAFAHVTSVAFRQYRLARQQQVAIGEKAEAISIGQYLASRGLVTIVGSAVLSLTIVFLMVMAYDRFSNVDSPLKIGFFDIANGQWRFTMEQVTRGAISINIPDSANLRNAIAWWVILAVVFQTILFRTRYGNSVFAVGGNRGAARAQGINVNRVKVQNFVLCSFLTGLAAIMEVARNPGVDPLKGNTWELDVIAMTVIGGTLLTGGYGSIIGTMLGVLIFGMLSTGLVLVGMDSRMFQGVIGVIMILAVVLNNTVKRSRS